jgi:hypothetical protein
MSTSNYASTPITGHTEIDPYLVKDWDTESLIIFLKEQNLKLEEKDFDILRNEEIIGQDFIEMTEEDFLSCELEGGPAMRLAEEAKTLKEKSKRSFSSYLSLEEVLIKYGIRSESITRIPQFVPGTLHVNFFRYKIPMTNAFNSQSLTQLMKILQSLSSAYMTFFVG